MNGPDCSRRSSRGVDARTSGPGPQRLTALPACRYKARMTQQLPQNKEPVLRMVPMPADANQHGDIFGGWIMAQVDIAGGVMAARRARGRVATIAVNAFVFKQPVLIGDLLSFYADIVRVGKTSITVNVEVYASRNPEDLEVVKVTEATLTYVATDAQRKPRSVPGEAHE
jgi:acyl-CoA thioesterase YciA